MNIWSVLKGWFILSLGVVILFFLISLLISSTTEHKNPDSQNIASVSCDDGFKGLYHTLFHYESYIKGVHFKIIKSNSEEGVELIKYKPDYSKETIIPISSDNICHVIVSSISISELPDNSRMSEVVLNGNPE